MSYEEEQYAGDMGGRQAARDAQIEAARLQAEADELAARVNESQDVDPYDEGPTEPEPVPEPEPEPEPEDEDPYGEEAPPPVEVEEEEVEEEETTTTGEDDPYEDPEPPPAQEITGQDIVGDTDTYEEDTSFAGTILGVKPKTDIDQMGYDTPEYIPPEKYHDLKVNEDGSLVFDEELTFGEGEDAITYNLTGVKDDRYGSDIKYEWLNDADPKMANIIKELENITDQINDLNDPANNGFIKVPVDEPFEIKPAVLDPLGNVVEPAVFQDFEWVHQTVIDSQRKLESHALELPTSPENMPKDWTLIDIIDVNHEHADPDNDFKVRIHKVEDHDDNPNTPEELVFNEDGSPVYVKDEEGNFIYHKQIKAPDAALELLASEEKERLVAEKEFLEKVEELEKELEVLTETKEKLDFWDNHILEREVPVLDDKGNDTGKTEMKKYFAGDEGQYYIYSNLIEKYTELYEDLQEKETAILGGYNPVKPKLDKEGNPVLDDENNPVMVPDFLNNLRGNIFEQVPEGEGKYIKNENGDFIKSNEGTFNIKINESSGLPFENLWTKYFNESDDTQKLGTELQNIATGISEAQELWNTKQQKLIGSKELGFGHEFVIHKHHDRLNPNSTISKILNNDKTETVERLNKQNSLIIEFDRLRGTVMSGNKELSAHLTTWTDEMAQKIRENRQLDILVGIAESNIHKRVYAPEAGYMTGEGKETFAQVMYDPFTGKAESSQWITPKAYSAPVYTTEEEWRVGSGGDFYHGDTDISGRVIGTPLVITKENWRTIFKDNPSQHVSYYLDETGEYKKDKDGNNILDADGNPIEIIHVKGEITEDKDPGHSSRPFLAAPFGPPLPDELVGDQQPHETRGPIEIESGVVLGPDGEPLRDEEGRTIKKTTTVLLTLGEEAIMKPKRTTFAPATVIPSWAKWEDGTTKPGYRVGLTESAYTLERAQIAAESFADLTAKEQQNQIALVQADKTIDELQGAINIAANFGMVDAIMDPLTGEWKEGTPEEVERLKTFEQFHLIRKVMVDWETGELFDKKDPRYIERLGGGEKASQDAKNYYGNYATVMMLAVAQNADLPIEQKIGMMTSAGFFGSFENIVRYNPHYDPDKPYSLSNSHLRWGKEEIPDVFQAYTGGLLDLVPGQTGVVAPSWYSASTLGGKLDNWAGADPDGPTVELIHSGELGLTAEQRAHVRLSFGEMGSIFHDVSDTDKALLVGAYQAGSTAAEWGMDIGLGRILSRAGASVLKAGRFTGVTPLVKHIGSESTSAIKGGFDSAFQPIVSKAPTSVRRVGGEISKLAGQTIFDPGHYAQLGQLLEFSQNLGTLGALAGKHTIRGARRLTGKDFLREVAELQVLEPRLALSETGKTLATGKAGQTAIKAGQEVPLSQMEFTLQRKSSLLDNLLLNKWRGIDMGGFTLDVKRYTPTTPKDDVGDFIKHGGETPVLTKHDARTHEPTAKDYLYQRELERLARQRMAIDPTLTEARYRSGWYGQRQDMDPIARLLTRTVEPRARQAGQRIMSNTIFQPYSGNLTLFDDTWATGLQYGRRGVAAAQEGGRRIGGRITEQYDNWHKRFYGSKQKRGRGKRTAQQADKQAHEQMFQHQLNRIFQWKDLIDKSRKSVVKTYNDIKYKDSPTDPYKTKMEVPPPKVEPAYQRLADDELNIRLLTEAKLGKKLDTGVAKVGDEIFPQLRKQGDLFDDSGKRLDADDPKKKKSEDEGRKLDVDYARRLDDLDLSGRPKGRRGELPIEQGKKLDVPSLRRADDIPGGRRIDDWHVKRRADDLLDELHLRKLDNYGDDLHFRKGDWGRKWDVKMPWRALAGLGALAGASLLRGPGKGGGGVGMRGTYAGRGRGHTIKRDIRDIKLFGTADFLSPKSMSGFFQPKTQPQITVKKQRPATSLREMVKKDKGGRGYY